MEKIIKTDIRENARMHGSALSAAEQADLCRERYSLLHDLLVTVAPKTAEWALCKGLLEAPYAGNCTGDPGKLYEVGGRNVCQPKSALEKGHYITEISPAGNRDSRQRSLAYSAEFKSAGGAVTDGNGQRYNCKYIVFAVCPAEWLFTQPLKIYEESRVIPTQDFYTILDAYRGRKGGSAYKVEKDGTVKLQFNSYLRDFLDTCFNGYPTLGDFLGV